MYSNSDPGVLLKIVEIIIRRHLLFTLRDMIVSKIPDVFTIPHSPLNMLATSLSLSSWCFMTSRIMAIFGFLLFVFAINASCVFLMKKAATSRFFSSMRRWLSSS